MLARPDLDLAGIPFAVGRPEAVATLPEYRGRGLVRALFGELHRWSAERGQLVQAITGIAYFYRQFGYEMTIQLEGGRSGLKAGIPGLSPGKAEPYRIRPATEVDLGFIGETYALGRKRYLVSCPRDAAMWRYELQGRSDRSCERRELRVIEDPSGKSVGFLMHDARLDWPTFRTFLYELSPETSWAAVTPTVLRYLVQTGEEYGERDREWRRWTGAQSEFESVALYLGVDHPAYPLVEAMLPREHRPYAWYIRVPDLPAFLRHISAALEARLASSAFVGYTGELKLGFYTSGLRLTFDRGRIATVEPWKPAEGNSGDARFPDLTFLHLLFGHRALAELEHAFADCRGGDDATRALLGALFPKRSSDIWPIA